MCDFKVIYTELTKNSGIFSYNSRISFKLFKFFSLSKNMDVIWSNKCLKSPILKYSIFLSALLFSFNTIAQNPKNQYPFLNEIALNTLNDTTAWKFQTEAVNYSFVLNHKKAIASWSKSMNLREYTPSTKDSMLLRNGKILNAKDYIITRAKNEELLIINEAHHLSMHRSFTLSLLKELFDCGYKYLALEALHDTLINNRKFATLKSGYYTQEPEFGNLINEALKIGYKVFGYETLTGFNGKEREIEQAKNIQNFLNKHPKGKLLIHCGFDHVYENEVIGWEKAMAGRLKEYLGVDPFTIDQVRFTEKGNKKYNHLFIYAANQNQPFVLMDENNIPFNGFSEPKQTDIVVIHPTTLYLNDRPNWFVINKNPFLIKKRLLKNLQFPIQIIAYREKEYLFQGIPADIIEVNDANDLKKLYLSKGKYTILIRNNKYQKIKTLKIQIN